MTKEQVKAVLDRVLTWPPERQQDVADMLALIEEQDRNPLRLTEEQRAEIRRRRGAKNPAGLTMEEFDRRSRRFDV